MSTEIHRVQKQFIYSRRQRQHHSDGYDYQISDSAEFSVDIEYTHHKNIRDLRLNIINVERFTENNS